jgi:hypothetical protein
MPLAHDIYFATSICSDVIGPDERAFAARVSGPSTV